MHELREIFTGKFTGSKWAALGEHLMSSITRSGPGLRMRKIGNQTIITAKRQRGRRGGDGGRFLVSYDGANQRLYVGPGHVFSAGTGAVNVEVDPFMPTLDDTLLDADPAPYWDVAGKEVGVGYKVCCVIDKYYNAHMVLKKSGDEIEWDSTYKNAVTVATIVWEEEGGSLIVDDLRQIWHSDIPWFYGESDDSSGSSESQDSDDSAGSSAGSSGGDSDDSDMSEEDSSDSDDSSDSSDESSSGCAQEIPVILSLVATLVEVAGSSDTSCLMEDETNSPTLRSVTVRLTADLSSGAPGDCRIDLVMAVGGRKITLNVGNELGGGEYTGLVTFNGFPCTEYTASAQLFPIPHSGSGLSECCLDGTPGPKTTTSITLPGLCSNFGECEPPP